MPTFSGTKTYDDGTTLTESQLDAFKNSVETFLNTTKIDTDNIQTNGIATVNITDSAITAAKIASDAVTTAKILDSNVTTAKIAALAVTRAKMEAVGQQISSSSSTFTSTNTSYVDVTNLTVTITTTGRPVQLALITIEGTGSALEDTGNGFVLKLVRDSTDISEATYYGGTSTFRIPPSSFSYLDVVAAGTYVYKVQVKKLTSGTVSVTSCRLAAFEL